MSRKDTNIWLLLKEQQKQQKVGEFVNTRVFFPFFFSFFGMAAMSQTWVVSVYWLSSIDRTFVPTYLYYLLGPM